MTAVMKTTPLLLLVDVFNDLCPQHDCQIVWVEGLVQSQADGPWGETCFPEDGSMPIISIDIDLPMRHATEILAHEMAHVAAGFDADHGPAWEAAFDALHAEYNLRMSEIIIENQESDQ